MDPRNQPAQDDEDLLRDIRDRLGGGLTRNELGLLEMLS